MTSADLFPSRNHRRAHDFWNFTQQNLLRSLGSPPAMLCSSRIWKRPRRLQRQLASLSIRMELIADTADTSTYIRPSLAANSQSFVATQFSRVEFSIAPAASPKKLTPRAVLETNGVAMDWTQGGKLALPQWKIHIVDPAGGEALVFSDQTAVRIKSLVR